jgi:hypothetical protein
VTVQAMTTVGVMKTQTLCFRAIGKNLWFWVYLLRKPTLDTFAYLLKLTAIVIVMLMNKVLNAPA